MEVYIDLYNGNPFHEDTEMLTFGPVDTDDVGNVLENLIQLVTTKPNVRPRAIIRDFEGYP